jgi:membrane-associated phospholipid phosphatase
VTDRETILNHEPSETFHDNAMTSLSKQPVFDLIQRTFGRTTSAGASSGRWGLKLLLLLTVPQLTTEAYLQVQRHIVFPVRSMPLTWLDRAIPFQPQWVWIYLSLYVMAPIGPLFTRSRDTLLRYAAGVLLYSALAFVHFFLFPMTGPRPAIPRGDWLYERLIRYDGNYNANPSLHAAAGVFAVLFAGYALREVLRPRARMMALGVLWIWYTLILYSTIATRQHYALDLVCGMFLGWLTYYLILPRRAALLPSYRVALCPVHALSTVRHRLALFAAAISPLRCSEGCRWTSEGSSSLKFSAYVVAGQGLSLVAKGQIEGLRLSPRFEAKDSQGQVLAETELERSAGRFGHTAAFAYLAQWLRNHYGGQMTRKKSVERRT